MEEKPSKKLRWYDRQPVVSKSVSLLENFPPEYQAALGETIIELAEKHCSAKDLMNNLRSLGPEKVLSIFKSKSKQRKTDNVQQMHQAMNYMLILPDEDRAYIAGQIIEVVGHVFEYFKHCKDQGVSPSALVVGELCGAYIRREFGTLQDFLAQLEAQNASTAEPAATAASNPAAGTHAFSSTGQAIEIAPAQNQSANRSDEGSQGEHDTRIAQDNKDMKIKLDKFDL